MHRLKRLTHRVPHHGKQTSLSMLANTGICHGADEVTFRLGRQAGIKDVYQSLSVLLSQICASALCLFACLDKLNTPLDPKSESLRLEGIMLTQHRISMQRDKTRPFLYFLSAAQRNQHLSFFPSPIQPPPLLFPLEPTLQRAALWDPACECVNVRCGIGAG